MMVVMTIINNNSNGRDYNDYNKELMILKNSVLITHVFFSIATKQTKKKDILLS